LITDKNELGAILMRIGFIGCVQSSQMALNTLLEMNNKIEVVGVITKKTSDFNADHVDLAPTCKDYNIPVFYEHTENKTQSIEFMRQCEPDIIYCFGWSFLLDNYFLTLPKHGVIGFHPAKLPQNRGRHPIIWALALGLESTASTFFRMNEGIDSGPILSQVDIKIDKTDNAGSLYKKILDVAQNQIVKFTGQLIEGKNNFTTQDSNLATTWRKRSRADGLIDWRMRAVDIYNLIRALSKPYPGAEFRHKKDTFPVWVSQVCTQKHPQNIEPGTVIATKGSDVLVKCSGQSAIWLFNIGLKNIQVGDYI
jgi:methionyl-tRNA formyltransferase